MSIGTMSKDHDDDGIYPPWGAATSIDTDAVDWSVLDEHIDADYTDDAEAGDDREGNEGADRMEGAGEPWGPDAGATTAEYAITTLAACGFAALLVVILKSEPIKELVTGVIETALGLGA